jgi:hypothetical protein
MITREVRGAFVSYDRYRPAEVKLDSSLQPFHIALQFTLYDKSLEWFDSQGIPYHVYRDVGKQYNPTRIAGYALASWNAFLMGKGEKHKRNFLLQADWFVQKAQIRGEALVWKYGFDWGNQLKAHWISGLAQGEALSVLTRAYSLTKNPRYVETARKAVIIMKVPVTGGGVLSQYEDGSPCLEEYPYAQGQPPHTLNGFIFAILGLYDYLTIQPEFSYKAFYQECLKALSQNLQQYDTGYWSRYDLSPDGINPSSSRYHNLHIAQLEALYNLTGLEAFHQYAMRWEGYRNKLKNRLRALMAKAKYRAIHPAPR